MTALREWQAAALEKYRREDRENFLAAVCPGAGKTVWALSVARMLLNDGAIDRVIVVCPSDALREQWSNNAQVGVMLRPFTVREPQVDKRGYDGIVTTYQALAVGMTTGLLQRAVTARTLVVLDEIHHAADQTSFGLNLKRAFGDAGRRLLLTGTPWRTDEREQMPFVDFDQLTRELCVDYAYSYGTAVADGVCRAIEFPLVNGRADFRRNGERRRVDMRIDADLNQSDESAGMLALLSADGDWLADVIERANTDLMSIRAEIPDAGGLIVAKDKDHAQRIKSLLYRITGAVAPVVISGEDSGDTDAAKNAITAFAKGRDPWIIAVKMIAEGVDVPRLMVGVYATTVTTAMFFNQVVGRFVRVRRGERVTSKLYVPPREAIWNHVEVIEQQLRQVKKDAEKTGGVVGEGDGDRQPDDLTIIGSTSDGLDRVHTFAGDIPGGAVEDWARFFADADIPTHYASAAAASGRDVPKAEGRREPPPEPVYVVEKRLRKGIKILVGKVAKVCYGDPRAGQAVNGDLMRVFRKSRSEMSVAELERVRDALLHCLETGGRL
jgi:superfamily II DNA or RNA helicase